MSDLAELIDQYYDDPVGFAVDVIDVHPTDQQAKFLTDLVKHHRVSVRSGHGIGKSGGVAMGILWYMSTRWQPKVPCTAPTGHQLHDVLWAEVSKWKRQMNPAFGEMFELTNDRLYHKVHPKEWFAVARTAKKESPDALQGFHADNLLFVIEEASGVPDEVFQPIEGALSGHGNMIIMVGNPTKTSGYFYDSHNRDREFWHTMRMSALDSPLVDPAYCERMLKKYGEHSAIYRVRVLGEFPLAEADQLIPIDLLEDAIWRDEVDSTGPVIWAVDPARFGDDETVLCKRHGNLILPLEGRYNFDTMQTVGFIVHSYEATPEAERPDVIFVDSIGIGAGVADRLRELGFNCVDINVSEAPSDKAQFANLRAEIYHKLRDWLDNRIGRIPDDDDLLAQCTSIKYKFNSTGKIILEKKEDLRKRGLPSPDRADAVAMTFARKVIGRTEKGSSLFGTKRQTKAVNDWDLFGDSSRIIH